MVQEPTTVEVNLFRIALEASICLDSLYEFVKMSWHTIEPHNDFVDNPHIKIICDELEACYRGEQTRLIINIPPRHMKSIIVSVMFPAWVWAKEAGKKFVCASYAESKARELSLLCRTLITSEWYQIHFPYVLLSKEQAEKVNFYNTELGFRKAYGFDGSITGDGGDFILIDDPLKQGEGESEAARKHANFIMDNVIPSRLNNPSTGVIVLIMQRLHEDDPTGHMLEQGGWEHLCLPEEYEGTRFTSKLGFADWRTEIGELLWPERFNEDALAPLKKNARGYATQYQQRPSPLEGNVFKRLWFNTRYADQDIRGIYISVDTALSVEDEAAKSAILVCGFTAWHQIIPLYSWEEKVEFPQLVEKIVGMAEKYSDNLYALIIENKVSGISAMQTIRQSHPELDTKIFAFNPPAKLTKVERAVVASEWCENGSVILPVLNDGNKDWLVPFEEELFNFPSGKYKDLVDTLVQLIFKLEKALAEGLQYRRQANYGNN